MMQRQKAFRFASQIPAISPTSTTPERAQARFAALLRRQAADIGETVTTCPPDAITHAMARLECIAAMICGKPGSLEAFRRVTESEVVL